MADYSTSLSSGVRSAFCQALPRVVAGGLLYGALTAGSGVGLAAGLGVAGGAATIYAIGCNQELPPSAVLAPPFTGGQCSGVAYYVRTYQDYTYSDGSRPPGTQGQLTAVTGPISSVDFAVTTGLDGTTLTIVAASGTVVTHPNTSSGSAPGTPHYEYSNERVEITRVDGLSDTCGNPPPASPSVPPGSNTVSQPVTYVNNDGDTITNNYDFTFGFAQVNIDGTLTIPVSVNLTANPTANFSGTFNLKSGDFNINIGDPSVAGDPGNSCADNPTAYPPPPDNPSDSPPVYPHSPETNDKPEKRKLLRGCLVTVTSVDGNQGELFQIDNPDVGIPDYGLVNFQVQVGGATGWTEDIRVKNRRQIILCPWTPGAIGVTGTPRGDNEFTITPVYTQISFPPQYPPES
jgi:hypothetical protein